MEYIMKKDRVLILESKSMGENFIPKKYIIQGKDEYYFRNIQNPKSSDSWRNLQAHEVESLVKNGNTAEDWDLLYVSEAFEPSLIKNCEFFGIVRIGNLQNVTLKHHDLAVPAGITNSRIIACDIGDNVAIHNVNYLAYFIIGNSCILINIDEMNTTNRAKFGNGIIKDGEKEAVRIWMDIMNETGSRGVLPFDGMITADAYLWGKYRQDARLMARLKEITQGQFDSTRGYYGTVGEQTVIKNSRVLKDVKIGSMCYIKGANKLKNLTIHSSMEEPTQIGEGVELVNGIIGYRCRIFYGCKAVRFIMGNNSNLKYGGRLINSFLGANSTISCCEVLNNLIFPSHEQHHNNSFLIAAVIKGQSNIAAGATIGSNHNSRANDNEIEAGRGFWPGLCTSIKHTSKFASFTLIAKGAYPAEMNIVLPFALVNNNTSLNTLEIMPAYWWMYNMYALTRNEWKYHKRDNRITKTQNIEYDTLAPDTVEEIINGLEFLEDHLGLNANNRHGVLFAKEKQKNNYPALLTISNPLIENSRRKITLLKPFQGYTAYLEMLLFYSVKHLFDHLKQDNPVEPVFEFFNDDNERISDWVNLGGQLITRIQLNELFSDIKDNKLNSWNDIHSKYDTWFALYPEQKFQHGLGVLKDVLKIKIQSNKDLEMLLNKYLKIHGSVTAKVFESRKKDYDNPFKKLSFENPEEMQAVLGKIEDNSFIASKRAENEMLSKEIEMLIKKRFRV